MSILNKRSFARVSPNLCLVFVTLCSVAAGAVTACSLPEKSEINTSEPLFLTGGGPLCGHEDLMRFGVDFANEELEATLGKNFFPSISEKPEGLLSDHPFVQGVYRTDFPNEEILKFYNSDKSGWHENPELQSIHALRNFNASAPVSAYDACLGAQEKITKASIHASQLWKQGEKKNALFWLGHASHIIQDSFSKAHSRRLPPDYKILSDVCTYGKEVNGVCFHPMVSSDDRIWISDIKKPICALAPSERSWSCLKDNAQAASIATAGYLRVAATAFEKGGDIGTSLSHYFEEAEMPDSGFFRCSELSGAPQRDSKRLVYKEAELSSELKADLQSNYTRNISQTAQNSLQAVNECCQKMPSWAEK